MDNLLSGIKNFFTGEDKGEAKEEKKEEKPSNNNNNLLSFGGSLAYKTTSSHAEQKTYDYLFKILLIGDHNVGKVRSQYFNLFVITFRVAFYFDFLIIRFLIIVISVLLELTLRFEPFK